MSRLYTIQAFVLTSAFALGGVSAVAQTDAEHAQHHPQASASKPIEKVAKPTVPSSAAKEATSAMDSTMMSMQDMHEKMMNAKTPEERSALMADHMKAMQDGMSMMGKMKEISGTKGSTMDMASHHQMMEKRMDMMLSMMQMMMDRMPAATAK